MFAYPPSVGGFVVLFCLYFKHLFWVKYFVEGILFIFNVSTSHLVLHTLSHRHTPIALSFSFFFFLGQPAQPPMIWSVLT